MKQEILDKLKNIKLFLFDLEGVLLFNDNSVQEKSYGKFLEEITNASKTFANYSVLFGIVTARKEDELIEKIKEIENLIIVSTSVEKVSFVEELVTNLKLNFDEVFYMGDEVLDIPLLRKCGLTSAPKNSNREVKRVVNFTIDANSTEDVLNGIFNLFQKAGLNESGGIKGNIPTAIN